MDEEADGIHDIVFGQQLCVDLGLAIDYKNRRMIWEDVSISMRRVKNGSDESIG